MKRRTLTVFLIASVCLSGTALLGQEQQRRQSVTLPADAKAIFLAQMLGHVVSLDGIVTALGQTTIVTVTPQVRRTLARNWPL